MKAGSSQLQNHRDFHEQLEALDDQPDNLSSNSTLDDVVEKSRRNFYEGWTWSCHGWLSWRLSGHGRAEP